MKPTSGVTIAILVWIVISFVIVGIASISFNYYLGSYHPFPMTDFGALGIAASYTSKYLFPVVIAAIFMFILGYYPRPGVFVIFTTIELVTILLTWLGR